MPGVITASQPSGIAPFTGLSPCQFDALAGTLRRSGVDQVRRGWPWSLPLEDRVLAVAAYWRTNLTLRQLAPLFGVSKSAADRIIRHLAPSLALHPRKRYRRATVLIVDGTSVPTHDHTIAERSKNYRYPTNHQMVVDADGRLVVAVGRLVAGNVNDCTGLLIPHRRRPGQAHLPGWKQERNAPRKVRARVEHAFARMKNWKILRDCRLKGDGVHYDHARAIRFSTLAAICQAPECQPGDLLKYSA